MFRGRILAITDAPFALTGYGNQAEKILSELVKRGWDVYAMACNHFPNGTEPVGPDGYVRYKGIKCILRPEAWNGNLIYPTKEEVKRAYDKINPDVVWSLNDFYRVKDYLELGEEFVSKWVHWLPIDNTNDDAHWRQFEEKMNAIVMLTKFGMNQEGVKIKNVKNMDVIYHGINHNEFTPINKADCKARNGTSGKFVAVTVARHQPRKMVYHTAHAVSRFLQKHPDAMWLCKCDVNDVSMKDQPEDERDLKKLVAKYGVQNQVVFIEGKGFPPGILNDLYNNGDVFISLTGGEGFNIPVAESMLAEVPCIITNSTAGPELLDNGRLGFLVTVQMKKWVETFATTYDIADLDEAVAKLEVCYDDWKNHGSAMLTKMGAECRKFGLDHFSVARVCDQWEEMFQKVIRGRNPVLWHTFFGKGVGFSAVSETIIPALEKLGYMVYCNDFLGGNSPILDPHIRELYSKYVQDANIIDFAKQPQVVCFNMEVFPEVKGDYKIGWSLVESTKLRGFYTGLCNSMDYIVTSCEFNRQVQKNSGIINPIYIVPPCIDTQKFPEVVRPTVGERPFTFLHIGVVQERKNPAQALDGYCLAFPDDGKTKFILKSGDFGELSWFQDRYGHRKDVELIYTKTPLSQQELIDLYGRADCYVNLSHGEGIGMPDLEALATGLPVIGNNWDARGEFLDNEVGWMVKIAGMGKAYTGVPEDCGEWAYYDGQDYINILQYVVAHPEEAREKGRNGAERVRRKFTTNKAARALDDLFMDIYRKKNAPKDNGFFDENYYTNVHKYTPAWHEGTAQMIINNAKDHGIGMVGKKVLDIGCGRGYVLKHLLKNGVDANGVEISEWAVKHPIEGCEGKIKLGDATKLEAANKSYDWAFGFSLMEHIPEKYVNDVLSEMARVADNVYLEIAMPLPNGPTEADIRDQDPTHITVHTMDWWVDRFTKAGLKVDWYDGNMNMILTPIKYKTEPVTTSDRVLVEIPTKDRVRSLERLLDSLANQTVANFDVVVVDDSRYDHIHEDQGISDKVKKLYAKGVSYFVTRGKEINQAVAHNMAIDHALNNGYKLVYRVDDDVSLKPDNIERLFDAFVSDKKCEFAAIGGLILNPYKPFETQVVPSNWKEAQDFAGSIYHCVYWAQVLRYPKDVKERTDIEHLYSSFMFRPELLKSVGGFPGGLSPVAHREETVPIYELWLKGYKLKIVTSALAVHFCEGHGGCRSVDKKISESLYYRDEETFRKKITEMDLKYGRDTNKELERLWKKSSKT